MKVTFEPFKNTYEYNEWETWLYNKELWDAGKLPPQKVQVEEEHEAEAVVEEEAKFDDYPSQDIFSLDVKPPIEFSK